MRQRKRHEQVIGIASSGIEYEMTMEREQMTKEREPTPSYYRHPRRSRQLAAHITAANPTEKEKPHARTRTPPQA